MSSCTRVVPAATSGGADYPNAFEFTVAPAVDLVAHHRVGRQVADAEAGKVTLEVVVAHPAENIRRRNSCWIYKFDQMAKIMILYIDAHQNSPFSSGSFSLLYFGCRSELFHSFDLHTQPLNHTNWSDWDCSHPSSQCSCSQTRRRLADVTLMNSFN